MLRQSALAALAAALVISPAAAQTRGAGAGFGISAGTAAGSRAAGSRAAGRAVAGGLARFHPGRASSGALLLPYPYFDSDYDGAYASQEASQPQVIIVPAAAPAVPSPPAPPRESLLIEWQGDHFVRTTMSARDSGEGKTAPDYSEKSTSPQSASGRVAAGKHPAAQPPRQLPPAVLVFHDGRKEQVSEYTIMSGTIYSKADYWTTGSWTKKIQIADLDLPATLKINRENGVKFALPSSANEVMIRP